MRKICCLRVAKLQKLTNHKCWIFLFVIVAYVLIQCVLTSFTALDDTTNTRSTAPVPEPYVPGSFIKDNKPSYNASFCIYNYGLPYQLQWDPDELKLSPENSTNYRILYNVVNNASLLDGSLPQVTYSTHASLDYINHISEIARFWDGPVSFTLFLADCAQIDSALEYIYTLCLCLPDMYKVVIHLLFPKFVNSPVATSKNGHVTSQFSLVSPRGLHSPHSLVSSLSLNTPSNLIHDFIPITNTIETTVTCRLPTKVPNQHAHFYPINVARNSARNAAQTKHVLVADIELIPSENLAINFFSMLDKFEKYFQSVAFRYVFVVPVFEIDAGVEEIPRRKSALLKVYENEKAVYFHKWICSHCQRFPGLRKWFLTRCDNEIKPLVAVKREYPYHRWEPVYVGTNDDPWFNEQMSWQGKQDKMTQVLEMCLMQYRFIILDGAFLVHWPGIKRIKNKADETWRRPFVRNNSKQYTAILKRLASNYVENKRCILK